MTNTLRPSRITVGGQDRGSGTGDTILIETAEWLIRQGSLIGSACPVAAPSSETRYIVSTTPAHKNGEAFKGDGKGSSGHELSNGLFLDTNLSAPECERRARSLLEEFSYTPSTRYLAVEWDG